MGEERACADDCSGVCTADVCKLPAGEERLFRVDEETQVKGVCHWQRDEENFAGSQEPARGFFDP